MASRRGSSAFSRCRRLYLVGNLENEGSRHAYMTGRVPAIARGERGLGLLRASCGRAVGERTRRGSINQRRERGCQSWLSRALVEPLITPTRRPYRSFFRSEGGHGPVPRYLQPDSRQSECVDPLQHQGPYRIIVVQCPIFALYRIVGCWHRGDTATAHQDL